MLCEEHTLQHVVKLNSTWHSFGRKGLTANFLVKITQEPAKKIVAALRKTFEEKQFRPTFCSGHAGAYVWAKWPRNSDGTPREPPALGYSRTGTPLVLSNKKQMADVFADLLESAEEYPGGMCRGKVTVEEFNSTISALRTKLKKLKVNERRASKWTDCLLCVVDPYKRKEK